MGVVRDYIAGRVQSLSGGKEEEVGIAAFSLFAKISEAIEHTSTVPTSVLEDGSTVADHIINNPITITIQGETADIFLRETSILPPIVREVDQFAQIASPFIPNRTAAQINRIRRLGAQANTLIQQADQAASFGKQAYDLVRGSDSAKGIEEQFVDHFTTLYQAKELIDIETKFKVYKEFAITSLTFDRDNQKNSTQFTMICEEIRKASLQFQPLQNFFPSAGEFRASVEAEQDKGTQQPRQSRSAAGVIRDIFRSVF